MKSSHNKHTSVKGKAAAIDQVFADDLKNAVLVVSLLINLVFLIAYMIMQLTSAYDHQVISILLTR